MVFLKIKALTICVILAFAGLSSYYIYDKYIREDEKPRFQWPEKENIECQPNNENYGCSLYVTMESTPTKSLKHPIKNEVWISNLDGIISSWDGERLVEVGNLSQHISRCHQEQGLLSFTFAHDYNLSKEILFSYTEDADCSGDSSLSGVVVAVAEVIDDNINLDSLIELRRIAKENRNHNGGNLMSLSNGSYLWSIGDGGGSGDPFNNGQNFNTSLGTIQYFAYSNKSVTPILNNYGNDSDYVLHHGLRNPWRFDVDDYGRLWIADVGQYCYEEVNMVPLLNPTNFGWSIREGMHDYDPDDDCTSEPTSPNSANLTDPIIEYAHFGGNCSITGGYWMNWGPQSLQNGYIYGDFCTGAIWKISDNNGTWESQYLTSVGTFIAGFGQGLNDELLIFGWAGSIYSIYDQ